MDKMANGGMSSADMERGYSKITPADPMMGEHGFPMYHKQEDDSGTNVVGDPHERSEVGFLGRPSGDER